MSPKLRKLLLSTGGTSSGGGPLLFSSLGLTTDDPFNVSAGTTVLVDVDTPSLGYTDIAGSVIVQSGYKLETAGITIETGGTLQIGTESSPIPSTSVARVRLTGGFAQPTGSNTNITNPGVSRAILVMAGGTLDLHGTPPNVLWTQLNDHGTTGSTSMTLATSPNWLSGDDLVIAWTGFVDEFASDYTLQRKLSANTSGTSATITAGVMPDGTASPNGFPWNVWGKLQYPLDTPSGSGAYAGMSLTPGTFTQAHPEVPTVLDERARVYNLTRNVIIDCPADTDWTQKGHGCHVMWMASGSTKPTVRISGVQMRRGGQRGMLGRYPFHAHMNSYTAYPNVGSGTWTGDTPNNYVKKCVVWDSENRAYTIHGTNGMTVDDNFAYNVKGHAYFLEDGSERRNNIHRNGVMRVRPPSNGTTTLSGSFVSMTGSDVTGFMTVNWTGHGLYSGQCIQVTGSASGLINFRRVPVTVVSANQFTYPCTFNGAVSGGNIPTIKANSDQIKLHDASASGYWYTNPDNKFVDNYVSDVVSAPDAGFYGNGVWGSFAAQCFGASRDVAIVPYTLDVDTFSGVVAHSCWNRGLRFTDSVVDEEGNLTTIKYNPSSGNFISSDHVLWKNAQGGYLNNVAVPTYLRWTVADNGGLDFEGSTNVGGQSSHHLCVGYSLNNLEPDPGTNARYPFVPRANFATYHGTVQFFDMNSINYPYAPGISASDNNSWKQFGGGVCPGGSDFYDEPGISLTHGKNTNIRMTNSHPGWLCPPLHLDGMPLENPINSQLRHYSIAMVWQDLDGKFGAAGKFVLPYTATATNTGGTRYQSNPTGTCDDYVLSGAVNLANGPLTGTAVCKTTDTRYYGLGWSDSMNNGTSNTIEAQFGSAIQARNRCPVTFTRQDVTAGTTIGTPHCIIHGGDPSDPFSGFRSTAVQKGGRYIIDFTDASKANSPLTIAAPTSFLRFDICNANTSGDWVLLGFPWANASNPPQIAFGHSSGGDTGQGTSTFPSGTDISAGRAFSVSTAASGANAAAKIAAVVADTTGHTYFHDTTANRLWVRWTGGSFPAQYTSSSPYSNLYDIQTIFVKFP